jgi:mRNA-degrading endonuclease YafQ of YafQ-DinJ toxin-antitoxin module
MYSLIPTPLFLRKAKKLIKKNNSLKSNIQKTLTTLEANPFDSVLKTHMVIRKNGKEGFSSYVTGDIRIRPLAQ